jgi:co-chaperonin GroES (HSP10)
MNSFKGRAVNFNVVVQQIENKQVTASGFDITAEVDKNQKFKKGLVFDVGIGCPKDEDGNYVLKSGDEIFYDDNRATPLYLEAIKYSVIHFQDITLIL